MNAKKLIAAAAVFLATGGAFAAEAPASNAAATGAAAAATSITASSLNVPAINVSATRTRAEVRAEAIEYVKNYKTTLALQLEQYK